MSEEMEQDMEMGVADEAVAEDATGDEGEDQQFFVVYHRRPAPYTSTYHERKSMTDTYRAADGIICHVKDCVHDRDGRKSACIAHAKACLYWGCHRERATRRNEARCDVHRKADAKSKKLGTIRKRKREQEEKRESGSA